MRKTVLAEAKKYKETVAASQERCMSEEHWWADVDFLAGTLFGMELSKQNFHLSFEEATNITIDAMYYNGPSMYAVACERVEKLITEIKEAKLREECGE